MIPWWLAVAWAAEPWLVRLDGAAPPPGCVITREADGGRWAALACMAGRDPREAGWLASRDVPVLVVPHAGPDLLDAQWHHHNHGQWVAGAFGTPGADIGSTRAWAATRGWTGARLAIVDTGFRLENTDLQGRFETPVGDVAAACGPPGHGSAVAAMAVANGEDGVGSTGVAYAEGQFLPIHYGGGDCEVTLSDLALAAVAAVSSGASVANLSFSFRLPEGADGSAIEAAFREFDAADFVVVMSAGNDGLRIDDAPPLPIGYGLAGAIVVGSSDARDHIADHSNFGWRVDLLAPGESIATTGANDDLVRWRGTSFAAPQVASTAALLREAEPTLTASEVRARILSAVTPLGIGCDHAERCVSSGGRLDLGGFYPALPEQPAPDSGDSGGEDPDVGLPFGCQSGPALGPLAWGLVLLAGRRRG